MYIVAIAWLYVTLMMAITEPSVVGGVLTFLFYGLFPLALVLWLFGGPSRRRTRQQAEAAAAKSTETEGAPKAEADVAPAESVSVVTDHHMHQPDRGNTQPDQR
jgi:hypothetical protein